MRPTHWVWPFGVAMILTLANAAKPVVVDDTAYLLFARHIAAHPLDPFGFQMFWYSHPQPAMSVLAPPVLLYWLAAGIALFGEHLLLLKLWLLPFALMYCFAAWSLLRRFACGTERVGLLLVSSPVVLLLFNFMLDVPAIALGLAAVAVFVRGCDRVRWGSILAAGVLAGLAAQTKYTMMTIPAVFVWYGLLHRRFRFAVVAALLAVGVFAGWETFVAQKYGVSHFLYHVQEQKASTGHISLLSRMFKKAGLFPALLAQVGGLAIAWGLYVGRGLGVGRRWVVAAGVVAAVGLAMVGLIPGSAFDLTPNSDNPIFRSRATGRPRFDLPVLVYFPLGVAVLGSISATVCVLGFRIGRSQAGWVRRNPDTWFLVGWLAIEVAAYFVLTPFPAARRVLSICIVLGLVACRLVSRVRRARRDREPGRWIVAYGVVLGFGLFAIDAWDALPARELATQASEAIGERGPNTVWTEGHWGWQYYTDRLGMRFVDPGQSLLRKGDWLVHPVMPDDKGLYRPADANVRIDPSAVEPVAMFVWEDPLAAQTIPNLYGGWKGPVIGRSHPRLRIVVYRILRDWTPPSE